MPSAWQRWFEQFGADLVSVIPVGARSKTIASELIGKVPGTLNPRTGLWTGTVGSMAGRIMTEAEAVQAKKDGAAIGIQGRNCPGIDIDVDDEELAVAIMELAFKLMGKAPVRRREGSSRRLLMYAGQDLRKRRIAWGGGTNVKARAVELLGRGQYYNVDGLHPSGKPYYWETDPTEGGPHDLPLLTLEQWDAFQIAVRGLLEARGVELTLYEAKARGLSSTPRTGLDDPRLWAPSPEVVIELLAGYSPEVLGHDDFVRHMVAIKASLGEQREDFYPDVFAWAPGIRSTEDEATRKVWDSITDAAIGWGWLVDKSGSPVAAQVDFAQPPPPETLPEDPGNVMLVRITGRWVFDGVGGLFHDMLHGVDMPKDSFNAIHADFIPYGMGGRKSAAAICINEGQLRITQGRTYRPGAAELITESGKLLINLWRPSDLVPREGDPSPWLDHISMLFPDPTARGHFLDWIAFVLQFPGRKIGHAIMLYSEEQGVGKDTALVPLVRGVGNANIAKIEPDDLTGTFTAYLKSQVIICNEMANFERRTVYNRLKAHLEMSDTWLPINEKFQPRYQVLNRQNWIFCTNSANAVSLEETDRRFWIYECAGHRLSNRDADKLYAWFDSGGDAIVVYWLLHRDISKFNPAHAPPTTDAKKAMIELAKPVSVRWLDEQFTTVWTKREFMTFNEILEAGCAFNVSPAIGKQMNQFYVTSALRKHRFIAIPGRHRIGDAVVTVWTRDHRPETMASSGQFLAARVLADQNKP
jgi:hypothetical protein